MCQSKPFIRTLRLAALLSISLLLCLPPHDAVAELSSEDKKLLEMNPEDILNSELTPPSVSKYWEEQGTTSVNKKGDDPFNTPAAVYIISSEDIRRSGVTSVMEALRMAPGVQVARIDSNKWAISIRGFNQQYSDKLNILVDGQSIVHPEISGAFWDEPIVPLEDIDRIEVIRGPGGVTWGNNATNGVINIITKHSKDTQGSAVSVLYGNEERGSVYARNSGKFSDNTFYRSFIHHKSINSSKHPQTRQVLETDWATSQAGFRIDGATGRNDDFLVTGNIYSGDVNGYLNNLPIPPVYVFQPEDKRTIGANLNGKISRTAEDLESSLQSYLRFNNFTAENFTYKSLTYDIDFQQIFSQSTRNEVTWGLGYRLYYDEINQSFYYELDPSSQVDNLFSAFLQDKYALIEDKLFLTVGSKFEYYDKVGFEPQPSIRLSYNPTENQTLWAATSRVARFPTRGERTGGTQIISLSPLNPNGYAMFAPNDVNSNIKPDVSIAYEVGYRIKPRNDLSFDLTAFYNDYSDIISYAQTVQGNNLVFTFLGENQGKAESRGLEFSANWQKTNDLRLEANYSFIETKVTIPPTDITLDNDIDNPSHQFSIRSQYNISSNVFWDNSLYYVSELENVSIPDYLRFDSRIAWRPIHGLELSIAGQNLLDDYHQEFTAGYLALPSTIGRSVYVKAAWEF